MNNLLLYSLIFLLFSCSDSDEEQLCYSFDIRSCQTDEYASVISENDTLPIRETKMSEWLDVNGIDVKQIKLVINFHEFVCEACDSCPQGDRYFIKVKSAENKSERAEDLRLLNFEEVNCEDIF